MLRPIEKAIIDSNIGLTPSNNGEQIRLTIPSFWAFKKAQKEGMPEDESKDGETQSQKLLEKFSKTLDEALSKKEKEIMTV